MVRVVRCRDGGCEGEEAMKGTAEGMVKCMVEGMVEDMVERMVKGTANGASEKNVADALL
jgi:hypothetical protein